MIENRLRAYDLREIDNPDARDAFRLKYLERLDAVLAVVRRLVPPGGRVLEVGCSQANAAILLGEMGYHPIATDILPDALRYAVAKDHGGACRFVAADVRALPFVEESFDAVVVGELIEHLPQPREALAALARTLKVGGIVTVTVPNGGFLRSSLQRYAGDMPAERAAGVTTGPEATDHIFEFDRASLSELARAAGLEVLATGYTGSVALSARAGALKRLLPVGAVRGVSRLLNRVPVLAARVSYSVILVARRAL